MAMQRETRVFGVKELRITKMLTDVTGQAPTYQSITTAVVASPVPTTTSFSVTPAGGATLTVGRLVTVGSQSSVITAIATDAITVAPAFATPPTTAQVVTMMSSVSVPGVTTVGVDPNTVSVDLVGDNRILATDTVLHTFAVEINNAKLSFDVCALMYGGTIVETGTTPNQRTSWALPDPLVFSDFMVEARCVAADASPDADLHIRLNKVKASDVVVPGLVNENYWLPKLKCKAVKPIGTTAVYDVIYNETGVAVA